MIERDGKEALACEAKMHAAQKGAWWFHEAK
jgi:hypothetical protein